MAEVDSFLNNVRSNGEQPTELVKTSGFNPDLKSDYALLAQQKVVQTDSTATIKQTASIMQSDDVKFIGTGLIKALTDYISSTNNLIKNLLKIETKDNIQHVKSLEKITNTITELGKKPREIDLTDKNEPSEKSFIDTIKEKIVSACGLTSKFLFGGGSLNLLAGVVGLTLVAVNADEIGNSVGDFVKNLKDKTGYSPELSGGGEGFTTGYEDDNETGSHSQSQKVINPLRKMPKAVGWVGEKRSTHTHQGEDYPTPIGTEVHAMGDGVVTRASPDGKGVNKGGGHIMEVAYNNGYTIRYMHLSQYKKKVGDTVGRDDVIALTGNTGTSKGPHLHIEVRKDGKLLSWSKVASQQNNTSSNVMTHRESNSKRILVVGDSYGHGIGDILKNYNLKEYTVVNHSIDGAFIKGGNKGVVDTQLNTAKNKAPYDVIILIIGTNDFNPKQHENGLNEFYSKVKSLSLLKSGGKILIIPPAPSSYSDNRNIKANDSIISVQQRFANSHSDVLMEKVSYAPVRSDRIHPSSYTNTAKEVANKVKIIIVNNR